jgi:hypothetical protein
VNALQPPGPENRYLIDHIRLLRRCLRELTGRDLVGGEPTDADAAEAVFRAPFVLLSHNRDPDPILTYGNLRAMDLFEISWEELRRMPSRLTAEAPDREERARLLARVAERGFIDDYAGIRVSRSGKRFRIERATIWNLTGADGRFCGQAAWFRDWEPL